MQAIDSLSRIISESESEQIKRLLDSITVPAILLNVNRHIVHHNDTAGNLFRLSGIEKLQEKFFPDTAIWNRVWSRILEGHVVTTVIDLEISIEPSRAVERYDLSLARISELQQNYAVCLISSVDSASIENNRQKPGKFPDENPNPVMRINFEGQLLYANRACGKKLRYWASRLKTDELMEGHDVFRTALETGSHIGTDITCGDQNYSVSFAPVCGCDYVNIYALNSTEKKSAERALQSALVEVRQLKNRLQRENTYLKDEIRSVNGPDEIIGDSKAQKQLLQKTAQVAITDATVLILGETGTGKELLARAIHAGSHRSDQPLVKVNCAALPAGLIESELFGHEKGAFTGAVSRKAGRFEIADGGTIFLDEIGDLPLELQAKLLRVLQEGEIERVGSSHTISVNVRVIAATNRNLARSMSDGSFREDLYYRLNVFPVQSPPLRERKGDIKVLAYHFLNKYCIKIGKRIHEIGPEILTRLRAYSWPGNVRELENVIERAIILTEGDSLQIDDGFDFGTAPDVINSRKTVREVEREMIEKALDDTRWRIEGRNGAAIRLGMAPSTLRERIKKYGINRSATTEGIGLISS